MFASSVTSTPSRVTHGSETSARSADRASANRATRASRSATATASGAMNTSPCCPVQRQLGIRARALERHQDALRAHYRRDPVCPGEDRSVRRRGAASRTIPVMCSRGSVAVSEGDRSSATTTAGEGQQRLLDGQAGEQACDPVRDVDHVSGTRGQDLVVQGREHRGDLGARGHDRGHAVLELVADPRRGRVDQRRIPGHRSMGHKDRGLVVVAGGTHALGEGHEVVRRLVRRRAQPGLLSLDRVRGNPAAHRKLAPSHVQPRAPRHARRRGHTGQPPALRHRHRCQLLDAHGRRGACGRHHCC